MEDKQRKLEQWQSLDCLRESVCTNKVIENWVIPLENYRNEVYQDNESYHDPVLCEFGKLTRWMLDYYGAVTARLFPHLNDQFNAKELEEFEVRARKDLMDSAIRLQSALEHD